MSQRNRTLAIVGGAVLVVLLILGIALVASSGDDGDDTASTEAGAGAGTVEPGDEAGGSESGDGADDSGSGGETRSVTVTGEPLPPLGSPDDDPAVGTQAPVLDGEEFDGTPITIGAPTDGPTMVVFLAHWCPHCNAEIPELIELDEAGSLPEDLDVVGVSTAVAADRDNYPPSEWIVEKGWPWPIMVDSADFAALDAYGGTGFPFTVMLDENGVVLARKSGSGSAEEIADWIEITLG
ncbi:MAG: TlpA disulfide reductase family protein [Acidimicrobiia bacterium]|nr:TlpA disulfide reductase family protein [Acidimicrobiia bacterium]